MQTRFHLHRLTRILACVSTAILFNSIPVLAQSPNSDKSESGASIQKPRSSLLDLTYDIRTLGALSALRGGTAAASAEGAPTVAQRTAAVEAYRREAEASGSPVRVSVARFGIPKNLSRDSAALSEPFAGTPEEAARNFLRAQRSLFPFSSDEVDNLRLTGRHQIGRQMALRFQQTVGGVGVFSGHVRVTVNESGEVVAAGADDASPGLRVTNAPKIGAAAAVEAAARSLGIPLLGSLGPATAANNGWTSYANPFGSSLLPINSTLAVFPVTATSARLAHRLIMETARDQRFEILVDAGDGSVLLRHSLVRRHGSARVFTESPTAGPRQVVQFPDGWIAENATTTSGNNVDAFLDADGDDVPDPGPLPNLQNGRAFSPSAAFDFPAGEGSTGQDPRDFPAAAVTNLFYFVNLAHDMFFDLGFDAASGNYQNNNLGQGGLPGDAIIAEAQDGPLTNNANFVLAPDGIPGRLQVGVFSGSSNSPDDDRDGSYDGDVVVHEYTHGVSSRLVGGPDDVFCLRGTQSNALGEGWSDYFSLSAFNDPVEGEYSSGNTTRGIRRFSYQNYPLTYADLGNLAFEEHLDGELWAATLWDLRTTLGPAVADQLVYDGMALTACDPSMIDARDAIVMAEAARGNARRRQVWEVFARHGMGSSARGLDGGIVTPTIFNEAKDLPADLLAQGANRNPVITSDPPEGSVGFFLVGENFSYLPISSDPDGDTLTFALTSGPPGMTINAQNGTLGWTVSGFTAPRVVITATDGKGGRVTHGFIIPVITLLTSDQGLTISAPNGSTGFAAALTQAATDVFQLTTRGGTGDVDFLMLSAGSGNISNSGRPGTDETISVSAPGEDLFLALFQPAPTYNNVTLTARLPNPTQVAANGTRSNLTRVTSDESFFEVVVPASTPRVTISTTGPSNGDVDLFVMKDDVPVCQRSVFVDSECVFDESSERAGNNEVIEYVAPEAGSYFVDLYAFRGYSGVTLRASFADPTSVSAVSGDGQSAPVLNVLPAPLVVEATGSGGPAAGVAVTFAVQSGSALLRNRVTATGTNGRAQTEVLLGPSPGPIMISATVTGLAPVVFTVNATSTSTVQISPGGVVLSTGTPLVTSFTPNSIITVFGSGFAPAGTFEIIPELDAQNRVTTNLANTCLEINGERSPMFAVLPTQVNAQASHLLTAGSTSVVVVKNCGLPSEDRSDPASATITNIAPGFFNFINTVSGENPIAALHGGGPDLLGAPGLLPGATFTPAKPGEIISLFATGLGPTNPPVIAGGLPAIELPQTSGVSAVTGTAMVTIGGIMLPPEDVFYVGLAPCCAGLYQIVVRVPANAPAGNLPVEVKVNGVATLPGPYITVQP